MTSSPIFAAPVSAEMADLAGDVMLCDASVAVAVCIADHDGGAAARAALAGRRRGLAGHAWFEAYSVLSRLPGDARQEPAAIIDVLARNFPDTLHLSEPQSVDLSGRLAKLGIAGGAVYDALVGEVARVHDLPLLSRDRRTAGTYALLGVRVEWID